MADHNIIDQGLASKVSSTPIRIFDVWSPSSLGFTRCVFFRSCPFNFFQNYKETLSDYIDKSQYSFCIEKSIHLLSKFKDLFHLGYNVTLRQISSSVGGFTLKK